MSRISSCSRSNWSFESIRVKGIKQRNFEYNYLGKNPLTKGATLVISDMNDQWINAYVLVYRIDIRVLKGLNSFFLLNSVDGLQ